uniref:Uncharacterized protein LOC104247853 n=1 Tax=Nicotiana sylvestris TaxID=4096 RepID=A0A1U7YDS9_NICSY|nr:PREDICTED: uncharacterized protein LOC104247853 [Nicotiana sylvestris]
MGKATSWGPSCSAFPLRKRAQLLAFAMLPLASIREREEQLKMTTSIEQQNGSVGTTTAAMVIVSSSRTMPTLAMAPCFISEDVPILGEETLANEQFVVTEAWKHSDFLCKNYILSCLDYGLYNVYSVMKTSKELRNTLEKKYKTLDVGLKKFVAAKFLKFKMVDSKSVITQVQELQVIDHDLLVEGMVIYVAFQVAAFIENLPHMWKDFKNYLKHMPKEMTLGDLIVCLRIEEENKAVEMKSHENSTIMDENIVEEGSVVYKAADCGAPKKDKKKIQANMIEKNDEIDDLCVMLFECNLVGNSRKWWIDSGATRHVFANKELFTSYATAGPNKIVFMENSATIKIEGTDKISLKMTSSKIVTLKDVLHVPKMRKNLVSTSLQAKNGFKSVFVSDKVVGSKNEMYGGHRSVNVAVSAMKAELGYLRKSGIFCAPVSSQMRSMYHRSKGRHRIESCVAPTHAHKRKRVCGRKSDAAKVPIFFAEANIPGQILFLFGALVLF